MGRHGLASSVGGCFQDEDRLHVLSYFIGKNFEEGVSISLLNCKMAGVAFLFRLLGLADVTKSFLVKKALRGYRKGRHVPNSHRPVLFAMLGVLLDHLPKVCSTPFEAVLLRTAFVLAFFGALRVGELVNHSKHVGGEGWQLQTSWFKETRFLCLSRDQRLISWAAGLVFELRCFSLFFLPGHCYDRLVET